MGKLRARLPAHSTVAAYTGLFLALATGGAWAADEWNGTNIVNDSIGSVDLRNDDIRTVDVRDFDQTGGGLTGADIRQNTLKGTKIDESTLQDVDAATLGGLAKHHYQPDYLRDSHDPASDIALTATDTVVLSVEYTDSAVDWSPMATASVDLYLGSGTGGQASCSLWASFGEFGDSRLSQAAFADFTAVGDDEQVPVVGGFGYVLGDGSASGFTAGIPVTIELRCSEASGDVRFDRGDLLFTALGFG